MAMFEDEDTFERTLWVGKDCQVFKIPPRGPQGYTANDWKPTDFIWRGRVRVTEEGDKCEIRLEDPMKGDIFAVCRVDDQLEKAVERVVDSSRYFVLRIQNKDKVAFIGMGFQERNDAFDFNVALDDHAKSVQRRREEKANPPRQETAAAPQPSLNLGLKQGQTITVNLKTGGGSSRRTDGGSGGGILLPPPPSASRTRSGDHSYQPSAQASTQPSALSLFGNISAPAPSYQQQPQQPAPSAFQQTPPQPVQPQFGGFGGFAPAPQQQRPAQNAGSNFFEDLLSTPAQPRPQQQQGRPAGGDPLADLFN